MFHSVSLFSQAPLARGSRALPSVLFLTFSVYLGYSLFYKPTELPWAEPHSTTRCSPSAGVHYLDSWSLQTPKSCHYLVLVSGGWLALAHHAPSYCSLSTPPRLPTHVTCMGMTCEHVKTFHRHANGDRHGDPMTFHCYGKTDKNLNFIVSPIQ